MSKANDNLISGNAINVIRDPQDSNANIIMAGKHKDKCSRMTIIKPLSSQSAEEAERHMHESMGAMFVLLLSIRKWNESGYLKDCYDPFDCIRMIGEYLEPGCGFEKPEKTTPWCSGCEQFTMILPVLRAWIRKYHKDDSDWRELFAHQIRIQMRREPHMFNLIEACYPIAEELLEDIVSNRSPMMRRKV